MHFKSFFPFTPVLFNFKVRELQCGGVVFGDVTVCESPGVRELRCGGVAVWGCGGVGMLQCG